MDERWKEVWLALSVVNLLFFRRWAEVLPGGHDYYLETARSPGTYFTLMALVLSFSALAWGANVLARRSGDRRAVALVRAGFVLVLSAGLWGIFVELWVFLGRPAVAPVLVVAALVLVLVAAGWVLWRHRDWSRRVVPAMVLVALVVSPLVPLMFAQGLYHGATPGVAAARFAPPLAGKMAGGAGEERFVIILFDELDERLLFEDRPDDLALPEFDRLRGEALHATHAYAPNAVTLRSIPSMTTGRFVESATPHSIDGNLLRFRDGGEAVEWRDAETMFQEARATGHDVGIVGTYHPYCRVFESVLSRCVFESHYRPDPPTVGAMFVEHLQQLSQKLPTAPLHAEVKKAVGTIESVSEARQMREIRKVTGLSEAAVDLAADPELELLFLHINAPHPTGLRGDGRGFYDRHNGTYTTGPQSDYFDNLALADSILGRIRQGMEDAGVWDRTTLLVTADHGYRAELWHEDPRDGPHASPLQRMTEHRVAFLFRPANGTTATVYEEPFNLVLLQGMTRAVLSGGLPSGNATAEWLDAHRTVGPAPVYQVR